MLLKISIILHVTSNENCLFRPQIKDDLWHKLRRKMFNLFSKKIKTIVRTSDPLVKVNLT